MCPILVEIRGLLLSRGGVVLTTSHHSAKRQFQLGVCAQGPYTVRCLFFVLFSIRPPITARYLDFVPGPLATVYDEVCVPGLVFVWLDGEQRLSSVGSVSLLCISFFLLSDSAPLSHHRHCDRTYLRSPRSTNSAHPSKLPFRPSLQRDSSNLLRSRRIMVASRAFALDVTQPGVVSLDQDWQALTQAVTTFTVHAAAGFGFSSGGLLQWLAVIAAM